MKMESVKEYNTLNHFLMCVIGLNYYTNNDGSPSNHSHVKDLIEEYKKFQKECPLAFVKTREEDVMVLPNNKKNSEKVKYSISLTSFIESYTKDNKFSESNIKAHLIKVNLSYRIDKTFDDIIKELEKKKNKENEIIDLKKSEENDMMLELEMDVDPNFLYFIVIIMNDKKIFSQPITNRSLKQYSKKRPREGLSEDRLNSNKKRRKEESYLYKLKMNKREGTLDSHFKAIFDEENNMRRQLQYRLETYEITNNIGNLKNSTISNLELSQILKEMKEKKVRNNCAIIVLEEIIIGDKIPIDIILYEEEIYLSYGYVYLLGKYEQSKKDCKLYLFNNDILKSKFRKSGENTIKFELDIINQEKFIEYIKNVLNEVNSNFQNSDSLLSSIQNNDTLKVFSFVSTKRLN